MKWPWHRAAEAERREADAEAELRRSRELLERDRRNIVEPLRRAGEANTFSALIRAAIQNGYSRNHRGDG